MREGFFTVKRSLIDSDEWLAEPFTRGQAWLDLFGLANHKDGFIRKRGIKVIVKRGQLGWSEYSLAERWKWSRGKVRRFLTELQTVQQIELQTDSVTTLITIINYDKHQSGDTAKRTTNGTTNGHQTDTNNKNNKYSSNEEYNNTLISEFEKFWSDYPRKQDKADARKAFPKARDKTDLATILAGVKILKLNCRNTDPRYIPHAATWLNHERWNDEIEPPPKQADDHYDMWTDCGAAGG